MNFIALALLRAMGGAEEMAFWTLGGLATKVHQHARPARTAQSHSVPLGF